MTLKELDDIEAQLDSTVPYYLPRLVREYKALLLAGGTPAPPLVCSFCGGELRDGAVVSDDMRAGICIPCVERTFE